MYLLPVRSEVTVKEKRPVILSNILNAEREVLCSLFERIVTKPTKWHVHPLKTQISLGIRPV